MFANPVEKLYVACLWHREIVYHNENHYSLSFKNKIAFFLFICQFSCLFVSRFVSRLQRLSSFFRLRERPKSAKRIQSKISVRASQITIAYRALSSSNKARQVQQKSLNKQTLYYFLKLSVTAELKRAELELYWSIIFSWINKSKTRAPKIAATRKKNKEPRDAWKNFPRKTNRSNTGGQRPEKKFTEKEKISENIYRERQTGAN